MASFQYEAMNNQGGIVSGSIVAVQESQAVERLGENGLVVLSLTETKERQRKTRGGNKKVKPADLTFFSRQLSAMLSAGIPVTQSIATLARQTENPALREVLTDIAASVDGGLGLSQSFGRHPKVFNKLYVSMISAGEMGGMLEAVLDRLAIMLQKEKQLNDNIKAATSYPKMVGGFAVLMFFGMLIFMVPIFEGFINTSGDLPAFTRFTFAFSRNIRANWLLWLLGTGVVAGGLMAFIKSSAGHALWESLKIKMPIFGPIIHKSVIARFARTLSTLLQGGIPVVQALQSAGPTSGSDLVSAAIDTAILEIESGKNISTPLESSGLFPPMVITMISVGEEAGTLPELLDKVAEFYEDDVATLTRQLGSMIEPLILVLVGGIVGGMLLSLYLPIFSVVTGG